METGHKLFYDKSPTIGKHCVDKMIVKIDSFSVDPSRASST